MPATPFAACDATSITLPDGRTVTAFGGCNYMGLSNHPRVRRAAAEAMERYGLSSTASREPTGNAVPHDLLEAELAGFLRVDRALLVPDGYLANISACQGLAAAGCTHAVIDSRAHASMPDASRTAGLAISRFEHADPVSLASALAAIRPGRAVVMTDGVFTADGEPAHLDELLDQLAPDDRLLVDDCHGLTAIGPGGRGSVAHAGLDDPRIVITSSLAKGFGAAGGVVAGRHDDIARCARAVAYVCTTPIAPAMAEATRTSLAILQADPTRVDRLTANAKRVRAGLVSMGLLPRIGNPPTQIAAFITGPLPEMQQLNAALLADGFALPLIRYPGGPAETFFRLSVNAEHTPRQIDDLLSALAARIAAPRPARDAQPARNPGAGCAVG